MSAFYNVDQPPFNMGSAARAIAAANNGLLFDPSDMSTMFQDAAGTTPVTAVEQPVGLILDKSQGLMLGPELVTNGTFDSTSWWQIGTGWSISDGVATHNSASGPGELNTGNIVTSGKYYIISFDRLNSYGGLGNLVVGGTYYGVVTAEIKRHRYILMAGSAGARVGIQGGGDYVIDNFSVRELYGNHATQSITASRPVLSARKNVLLATETLATQSVTTIAAQYTLSFTGTGSVTLSGAATGTLTGTGAANRVSLTVTPTAGTLTLTVSGSVTKAQLELGAVTGPYQRVNTATDYDTNPALFPKYLKFDGIDDYLNLPYMGLYAGGSCSVIVARDWINVVGDQAFICESSTLDYNPVYWPILYKDGSLRTLIRNSTTVILLDISSDVDTTVTPRVASFVDTGSNIKHCKNSIIQTNTNYVRSGAFPLTNTVIGAKVRTTTSGYARMSLYGLIITKSALTDAQRVRCERFLARKAEVML